MGQHTEFARGLSIFVRQITEQVTLAQPGDHQSVAAQPEMDMAILDDTWPYLWSDDFTHYMSNEDENMLPMYLLGLSQ